MTEPTTVRKQIADQVRNDETAPESARLVPFGQRLAAAMDSPQNLASQASGDPESARLMPFGQRLAAAMDERGPLCVGIDPHRKLLLSWGLTDDAAGLREFVLRTLDVVGPTVAAIKPQAAFFERHGSAGVAVMEELNVAARELGLLNIVDAKRGDIGSTMQAYAEAFLRADSPLAGDAVTVSPYLGVGALDSAFAQATANGKGVFTLCLTSNPEGAAIQHAISADRHSPAPVARLIAEEVAAHNREASGLGSMGLVIGATTGDAVTRLGIDVAGLNGPILAPGIGAQGAGATELKAVFGPARRNVLATVSRGVSEAGPGKAAMRNAIRYNTEMVTRALRG